MQNLINARFFATLLAFSLLLNVTSCQSQVIPERMKTSYEPLNQRLSTLVPVESYSVTPAEVQNIDQAIFLDAREAEEYVVSHLPGALLLGYDQPDYSVLDQLDKDQPLVVYCTVGYRSDKMVKKLQERGFSQVYNLYGSIFAWGLSGLPLVDSEGESTEQVHTYNRRWSQYYPYDDKEVY